jgi:hypothetical protein
MLIALTRGMFATVDDDVFEHLSRWRWYALKVGKKNGRAKFYAARTDYATRKCVLMHREIMAAGPDDKVDHREPDHTLDNRRANLRLASNAENSQNQRKRPRACTSRYKGVSFQRDRRTWEVGICANGLRSRIGGFTEEADAAQAYNFLALEAFGEFARMNEA